MFCYLIQSDICNPNEFPGMGCSNRRFRSVIKIEPSDDAKVLTLEAGFSRDIMRSETLLLYYFKRTKINNAYDYIMCNAQLQGHKKRDIASICCMCPN